MAETGYRRLPSYSKAIMAVMVSVLVVLACVALARTWLLKKEALPIRFVRVEGAFRYLEPSDVEGSVKSLVDTGYFLVDLKAISKAALALPWVQAVRIQRIWPDTLILRIDEQQPYVRWGSDRLLNALGEPFMPGSVEAFSDLLMLQGPEGKQKLVLGMLENVKTTLADKGLRIATLIMSGRRAWSIQLAEGMIIKMGRRQPWKALDRFLRSLPLLGEDRIQAIESVDLRYPNGFAVSWKSGTELEWRADPNDEAKRSVTRT